MGITRFPSRANFHFLAGTSDNHLWAIGMLVVTWNFVESLNTFFVHSLVEFDPASKEAFNKIHSSGNRVLFWEAQAKLKMIEPHKTDMLALINRVKQIQSDRDKIIHNNWNGDILEAEKNDPAYKSTLFSKFGPKSEFKQSMGYADVIAVAKRADQLIVDLLNFGFAEDGDGPGATLSLQKRLRRPESQG